MSNLQSFKDSTQKALDAGWEKFSELEKAEGPCTVETVLKPLSDLGTALDFPSSRADLWSVVHPDAAIREAAEEFVQAFSKLGTELSLSRPIYERLSRVDASGEDATTQRRLEHSLRDFRRAGVDKDDDTRAKIRALKQELVEISQAFGRNIREDVREILIDSAQGLEGLPQDYIDAHAADENGKIKITTDMPDYLPFLTYAQNDDLRRDLFIKFRQRGYPKNETVLPALIQKRHALAELLGYPNWATYVTEDKMVQSPHRAAEFLEEVIGIAKERAQKDYQELLVESQKSDDGFTDVPEWRAGFIKEHLKMVRFGLDSQKVRQYFTYAGTREGIFQITSELFDIRFESWQDAEPWHDTVEGFVVKDAQSGDVLGNFYLDMHPRADKYKHAAAFPLAFGVQGEQLPQACLVCNFPAEGPMEHRQVETFFHEFGHLLHHLLGGRVKWHEDSGFNTEWDFVEVPSQLLEEWAWDRESLKRFARKKTGDGQEEVIPDELITAMRSARDFGKGLWAMQQMFYAKFSLQAYSQEPDGVDFLAMADELQSEISPFAPIADTYFPLSFGHLDGYSAIYYTYMWSLAIAKDVYATFSADDTRKDAPRRYRDVILARGGSMDATQMLEEFLGRPYTLEAFRDWLNQDAA